jgi:peroxiredoxin
MRDSDTKQARSDSRKTGVMRWIGRAVLLLVVLVGVHLYQVRGIPSGVAPDFQARLLDGSPVSLSDYRGKPLLLQFWATWCPVCALEQASINRIARDHAVLSIAMDQASVADIRQWMKERGVDYPVARDPSGAVAARFGVRGVPTSLFIDAAGRIRFVEVGYTTEPGLRLRLWWIR